MTSYLAAQSDLSPCNFLIVCSIAGLITDKFSTAPFGLPGRFIISEFFLVPHTALETIAVAVILKLSARIASSKPGSLFSITSTVTSGAISRGEIPVEPLVIIKSSIWVSAKSFKVSSNFLVSSGIISFLIKDVFKFSLTYFSTFPIVLTGSAHSSTVFRTQKKRCGIHISIYSLPCALRCSISCEKAAEGSSNSATNVSCAWIIVSPRGRISSSPRRTATSRQC